MTPAKQLEFKVLIRRETGPSEESSYVAHCLNYDLVAAGKNVSDVLISLKRLILGQMMISLSDGIEPFSDFAAAPRELWDSYNHDRATEEDAFSVFADIRPGDLEFGNCQIVSGKALMKLAA